MSKGVDVQTILFPVSESNQTENAFEYLLLMFTSTILTEHYRAFDVYEDDHSG